MDSVTTDWNTITFLYQVLTACGVLYQVELLPDQYLLHFITSTVLEKRVTILVEDKASSGWEVALWEQTKFH